MLRCDTAYAKGVLEELNAAEAAAAAAGGGAAGEEAEVDEPLLGRHASGAAAVGSTLGKEADGGPEHTSAAVLPWWLPPEDIPAEHTGERQAGSKPTTDIDTSAARPSLSDTSPAVC